MYFFKKPNKIKYFKFSNEIFFFKKKIIFLKKRKLDFISFNKKIKFLLNLSFFFFFNKLLNLNFFDKKINFFFLQIFNIYSYIYVLKYKLLYFLYFYKFNKNQFVYFYVNNNFSNYNYFFLKNYLNKNLFINYFFFLKKLKKIFFTKVKFFIDIFIFKKKNSILKRFDKSKFFLFFRTKKLLIFNKNSYTNNKLNFQKNFKKFNLLKLNFFNMKPKIFGVTQKLVPLKKGFFKILLENRKLLKTVNFLKFKKHKKINKILYKNNFISTKNFFLKSEFVL